MLKVNEIYRSIQGESSYAGYPCTFVRLTGCNLRCRYCDTKYAYESGREEALEEILDTVNYKESHLVEITGGEPLMQEDTLDLISLLLKDGFKVLLETNGSYGLEHVPLQCTCIIDYKCPGSVLNEHYRFRGFPRSTADEIKFVLGSRQDYNWAKREVDLFSENKVHFSPVFGELEPSDLAKWILEDNLNVHLNLQLHKIIWGGRTTGV